MSAVVEFDPEPLSDLGDPETERTLVDMFLTQAADRIAGLDRAIAGADGRRVHELAHELKGSAATVGAVHLSSLCQRLCEISRHSDVSPARDVHDDLVRTLGATAVTMRRHAAGLVS